MPTVSAQAPRGFGNVETWVFDLDNTLYPHHLNLWQQVDERIRAYVSDFLKVSKDEAFRLQKNYYKRYGTTMRGMMTEHGMSFPSDYLDFAAQNRSFTAHAKSGARCRPGKTSRAEADPHQWHAQARRRSDAEARDPPSL